MKKKHSNNKTYHAQDRHPYFTFFLLLAVCLVQLSNSVVILPPVVYFASLSLAGFLANSLIALAGIAAVFGAANWRLFGKPFPTVLSSLLGFGSTVFLGILSMLLCAFLLAPRNMSQIAVASVFAASLSFVLLFLKDYRAIKAGGNESIKSLIPIAAPSILFALVFVPIAVFSIEYNKIETQPQAPLDALERQGDSSALGIKKMQKEAGAMPSFAEQEKTTPEENAQAAEADASQTAQVPKQPATISVWLLPQSEMPCIVEAGGVAREFEPKKECVLEPSAFSQATYCPILYEVPSACSSNLTIRAGGSCSQEIMLECKDSVLQLSEASLQYQQQNRQKN
ncbi:hypothetical protein FJZ26_00685 [Candidatus Parvarchaeota archaeon]|nr:hypothetical protein [Candidatus Parvarchaeota archaeon]